MDQTYGGSIMAAVMSGGFTPEWTKKTLANLIGQSKVRQSTAPKPFSPAPAAFLKPHPPVERFQTQPPRDVTPKELPRELPVVRAVKIEAVEIPMAARVKAIDVQRRQQVLVSSLNLQLPKGCHVLAYPILPLEMFQGELGKFLMMACDFFPYGAQNTLLLPALGDGATHFGLPKFPVVANGQTHVDAVNQIKALRQRVLIEHQRAASAIQSGDFTRVFDRPGRQAEYRLELANITRMLAIKLFGPETWETHEKRFRADLNRM
jgi:hypothetical protein